MKKILALVIILVQLIGCKKNNTNLNTNTCSSFSDIDGNTYNTVRIGTQCWMKENLKTSHYRDGSVIAEVQDSAAWLSLMDNHLTTGAWCYYKRDSGNNATYGKLYNWYAVANSKNICPSGWHVPSDSEWTVLITYLGGDTLACAKMKDTILWQPFAGIVNTNSSGFSARPAGLRDAWGIYFDEADALYWSSTSSGIGEAYYRGLYYFDQPVEHYYLSVHCAFSVRCVSDFSNK